MARYGQNALEVIHNLKDKIAEICRPAGGRYDSRRSTTAPELIHRAIETLKRTLIEESTHCGAGLRRLPPPCTQRPGGDPDAAGGHADGLHRDAPLGMNSNLMSLGGIAIAIGAMIDAAIVMIENAHKHMERLPEEHSTAGTLRGHADGLQGSGSRAVLLALIITVSFLPVFTLEAQEGRLFPPLAYTKTFSMAAQPLLSVTLVPVLMLLFIRGKIMPEAKNPVNRVLIWAVSPDHCRGDALEENDHRAPR